MQTRLQGLCHIIIHICHIIINPMQTRLQGSHLDALQGRAGQSCSDHQRVRVARVTYLPGERKRQRREKKRKGIKKKRKENKEGPARQSGRPLDRFRMVRERERERERERVTRAASCVNLTQHTQTHTHTHTHTIYT